MNRQQKEQLIENLKDISKAFERFGVTVEQICDGFGKAPESPKSSIVDVRTMDSMKMIEEILDSPKAQPKTLNFVSGLEEFLETRGQLSESQRFHLESTYQNIFGDLCRFFGKFRHLKHLFFFGQKSCGPLIVIGCGFPMVTKLCSCRAIDT